MDRVRRTPVKAHLPSPTASTRIDGDRLARIGRAAKSALVSAHGSGQAAAIEMGIDQSQVNRQLQMGTFDFRELAAAGDVAILMFGQNLVEEFSGRAKTKRQIALERLPELLALMLAGLEGE